jgi:hypothetical protein
VRVTPGGEDEAPGDRPAIGTCHVDEKPRRQRADERANSRRGVHETDQAAETIDAEHLGEDGGVERDAAALADPQHDREDDKQAVLRRDEQMRKLAATTAKQTR